MLGTSKCVMKSRNTLSSSHEKFQYLLCVIGGKFRAMGTSCDAPIGNWFRKFMQCMESVLYRRCVLVSVGDGAIDVADKIDT